MFEGVISGMRQRVHLFSFAAAAGSLRQRMLRGTAWTLLGYGGSQLLRFGGNLILTRLLYPELFGFMALVNTFLMGLALLSDMGIGFSIVQNRRGDEPVFLNTAWTIQVARGIGLWLVSFALAAPVAEFYSEPLLQTVLPVAAFGLLIAGFNATSLHTLKRSLRLGTLTVIELGAQAIGLVVMIILSWQSPGAWALVVGGLVSALARLIMSHWVQEGARNRFVWDAPAAHAIWNFGKWIFLTSAITFFGDQSDRLLLGKVTSLQILGIYGIALTLAEVPRQTTQAIANNVLFPGFSTLRDAPRTLLREKITNHRLRVLYVLAAGMTLLVCFGDMLIRFLYDPRYWQAAWMLPLLALGLWPRLLCNTIEPALFAIARPQYTTVAQAARVLWTVVGVLIGYSIAGVFGAVLAIASNDLMYYLVIQFGLWREGLSELRQDALGTLVFILLLSAVMGTRVFLGGGLVF